MSKALVFLVGGAIAMTVSNGAPTPSECQVTLKSFSEALSSIESGGNYSALNHNGGYNKNGVYWTAIGRYQMMNFREDVRDAIWLNGDYGLLERLDRGETLTEGEVLRMFPSHTQEEVASAAKLRVLDLAKQDGYTGRERVDWAAQMWFAGENAEKDATYTDSVGTRVVDYGDRVADHVCGSV